MSDSRSCGRCIYYNSITNECGEESKCMKDVDEAKYTSYIEGKKQGREDAFQEIAYSDSVIKEPFKTLAYEKGKADGINQCLEIVQKIKDEHDDSDFVYPINYGTLCGIIIKLERLKMGSGGLKS